MFLTAIETTFGCFFLATVKFREACKNINYLSADIFRFGVILCCNARIIWDLGCQDHHVPLDYGTPCETDPRSKKLLP